VIFVHIWADNVFAGFSIWSPLYSFNSFITHYMAAMLLNNLLQKVAENRICTVSSIIFINESTTNIDPQAFGVKVVKSNEVILLAKAAGYDTIFIDLEHSVLSIQDASVLCSSALLSKITPFVRVPYQCGQGFVQRVLDAGAMGIIFPHINTVGTCNSHFILLLTKMNLSKKKLVQSDDARSAISTTKFPPRGKRSLTAAVPQFEFQRVGAKEVIKQLDSIGSTVFIMVESVECLDNIDVIAALEGVDVLLIGANDLSLELGILGEWDHWKFQDAIYKISNAARRNGKILGVAGLYARPDISKMLVREYGARFVLGHLDVGLLAMAMNKNIELLRDMEIQ
jgi:2-keto-3-deoxy-L-rhamnonate aldolase RhmA